MSKIPLRVVQEIDPLVNLSNLDKRRYAAYIGGKTISYQPYLAPNVNNSTIQLK
jgi:hypothetical protein